MQTSQRFVGLDLLRAILMLIGPIFHIAMSYNPIDLISKSNNEFISHLFSLTHPFRMEIFFLLSGFFASFLIEKKGIEYFKKNKISKLYIPLFFSIIIIYPITSYLYNHYTNRNSIHLQHTWFLVSLGLISLIYFINNKRTKKIIIKIANLNLTVIITATGVFYSLIILYTKITFNFINKTEHIEILNFINEFIIINPISNLLPTILGSVLLYKNYFTNTRHSLYLIIIFILLHSIFNSSHFLETNYILRNSLRAIYFVVTFYLILHIFNYFKSLTIRNSFTLDFLINSSFTVYILHYPLVFLNVTFITQYIDTHYTQFIIINILTYSECFIIFILLSNTKLGRYLFGIKKSEINILKKIKQEQQSKIAL